MLESRAVEAAETPSVGLYAESSLHAQLIRWLSRPGDRLEASIDGFVADIARGDDLIEVQTGSFASLKRKLDALLPARRLTVAYPVVAEKTIVRLDREGGKELSRRKSPRRGSVCDLFSELIYLGARPAHPNFALLALLVEVEELRVDDGSGSWRRKGQWVLDRRLIAVRAEERFERPADYAALLPASIGPEYRNSELARAAGMRRRAASMMSASLARLGAVEEAGRAGREKLWRRLL
jgi:hypothetical protein